MRQTGTHEARVLHFMMSLCGHTMTDKAGDDSQQSISQQRRRTSEGLASTREKFDRPHRKSKQWRQGSAAGECRQGIPQFVEERVGKAFYGCLSFHWAVHKHLVTRGCQNVHTAVQQVCVRENGFARRIIAGISVYCLSTRPEYTHESSSVQCCC